MKIIEDLGQILVVLHTLLVIIKGSHHGGVMTLLHQLLVMTPRLNKQSGSDRTGRI